MSKTHMKILSLVILTTLLIIISAGLIITTIVNHRDRQGETEFSGTFVKQTGKLLTA